MPLDWNPFAAHKHRRELLDIMLDRMKREPCKSPFEEMVVDFLEDLLEYYDQSPAI